MSNDDGTNTRHRATVPQILADLLVLGHENRLPDPESMYANCASGTASITLVNHEQVVVWHRALGGTDPVRSQPYSRQADTWLHSANPGMRKGWHVHISALVASQLSGRPLDGADVLALADIATPPHEELVPAGDWGEIS